MRAHDDDARVQVELRVGALFSDADKHGPRTRQLVRRSLTPMLLLPVLIAAALQSDLRELVAEAVPARVEDAALVLPIMMAVVALGGVCAPLARVSAWRLMIPALVMLGGAEALISAGYLVWSTIPMAIGGILLGVAAARSVRRAVWVLPVLLAAGLSDAQSVRSGTTRDLLASAGGAAASSGQAAVAPIVTSVAADQVTMLDAFVLHLPALSGVWLVGLVDIVAVGLLLGLAHLYWLPTRRVAAAFVVVFGIAVMVPQGIPVLPLLGAAFVLVNLRMVVQSTRFSLRRLVYLGG